MESSVNQVEFPAMREEVLSNVRVLADSEHQWRVWIRHEVPGNNYWDSFAERLNNLADTQALERPYETIGSVLRNEREAFAMHNLNNVVDELFRKNGNYLSDEGYLGAPEWRLVVEAADNALKILTESDD